MTAVPMPGLLPLGWNPTLFARSVRVHQAIAPVVKETFEELATSCWSKLRTYDGGYAWRLQRGSARKISMHSYGGALDFDAQTNQLGEVGDMDPQVIAVFVKHGWTWGGTWKRRDGMHFQFGSGY